MKLPSSSSMRSSHFVPAAALLLSAVLLLTGCVSSKYQEAKKDNPPPQMLNVAFDPAPLGATLNAVITYNGSGSWKREAFWDEYVVTLRNPSSQPVTVAVAGLMDFAGTVHTAGNNPWALEKESKTLERKYKDARIEFVRYTTPILLVGASAGIVASSATFVAAGAFAGTLIIVPIYYVGVLTVNHYKKIVMEQEFNHRRFNLPLTLGPEETRTGSFFFPMVPNPRSLSLRWSTGPASGESVLLLDFLHGLHVKTPAQTAAAK